MKRKYCLVIQNLITGEIKRIPNYSDIVNFSNAGLCSQLLYVYLEDYIKNNIPFNIDYQYEVKNFFEEVKNND